MKLSLNNQVIILLSKIGDMSPFEITEINGGANNRVYKLETGSFKYLMKSYHTDKEDRRDRLSAEFGFSDFLWCEGIHCIPRPVVQDMENKNALFEYADGKKILPGEVNEDLVSEALEFWITLNSHKNTIQAKQIPAASEAYFSIKGHLSNVSNRLKNLTEMETNNDISLASRSFVANDLLSYWESLKNDVTTDCTLEEINHNEIIPISDRCLSPSDFGFHNAILTDSGELKFFDFEYAGWDDPAKFVCDYFCQPQVPVSIEHFSAFSETVSSKYSDSEFHQFRMNLLLPVYQIKWCAVMLNDFLSKGNRRREFSNEREPRLKRLETQLEKSMKYFQSIARERVEV